MDLSGLKWDAAGLVTVVVQDRHTGEVRMVAHASEEALRATVETGEAHFFSRSRQALWRKGETSGHTMAVSGLWLDCDADAVLYLVDPAGPSCHTGRPSCFYRSVGGPEVAEGENHESAATTLPDLWRTLEVRRASTAEASYTRALLDAGVGKIGDKLREEASELADALAGETDARVVSEAADVIYHLLVGLLARGTTPRAVLRELSRRFRTTGHEEKATRG